jgi:hypothetical protein
LSNLPSTRCATVYLCTHPSWLHTSFGSCK